MRRAPDAQSLGDMAKIDSEVLVRGDTMRVHYLVRLGATELREVEIPRPSDGEVLAKLDVALTCGTDLKMLKRGHARLPMGPFGHEWAGTVAAVGAGVRNFEPGDRIVATPTAPCGDCVYCVRREENVCLHLFEDMALGAYGEYMLVPRHIVKQNAYKIPDAVSSESAAMLEPLACVVHGADRLELGGDRTVAFIGDGPIALMFMQVARIRGAGRVIVIGRHPKRMEVARALGADAVIDGCTDVRPAVQALTDGVGADTVIECVGRPEVWEESFELARRGGEVLLFGGCEKGSAVAVQTEAIHYNEIDIRGAFHYTPAAVRRAWDLICGGHLTLDPLITHRMPLEDELSGAFDLMRRREALKVAIQP